MKCKQVRELMGAYLYGDLAPEEMREMRVHAQDCAFCREDLATRGRVVSSMGDDAPALSELDRERIAWSVKGAVGRKKVEPKPLVFRLAPGLALAGVLLVGFGLGRVATLRSEQAKAANEARKAHIFPPARISVQEMPRPVDKSAPSTDKVANQVIDLLSRAVENQATSTMGTVGSRGATSQRRHPQPAQDEGVKLAPEGANSGTNPTDATVKDPAVKSDSPAVTPDGSGSNPQKPEATTSPDGTKLPRVTDPKNAETTPSNP